MASSLQLVIIIIIIITTDADDDRQQHDKTASSAAADGNATSSHSADFWQPRPIAPRAGITLVSYASIHVAAPNLRHRCSNDRHL